MPLDTTNPPFRRPLAGGELGTLIGSRPELDQSLKIESLLLEEYNYASVTAYQALEDRARMFNLYLLLFGVVASGLGAIYQFGGPPGNTGSNFIQVLIVTLLIVGGLLGFAFFVKLIRLRQAYRESLICMNLIKEFYIQQFQKQMPQVTRAFRWRLKTIPAGERFGSVTFVVCYTVALLGSLCFGGAVLVIFEGTNGNASVFPSPLMGVPINSAYATSTTIVIVALLFHIIYYRRTLSRRAERELLDRLELEAERVVG